MDEFRAIGGGDVLGLAGRMRAFVRENVVMCVAALAALITCFIVPPDGAYLDYVDVKTIACLFGILAVVGAMRNLGMFQYAARKIIARFRTCRAAAGALVGVTLLISMVATNDMALIMMLPLSAATLLAAGWARVLPFTFIMQNLAANLGGMILPFGNPQNLYLFEYFHIDLPAFLDTMFLPFAVSVLLIALCCIFGARSSFAGCVSGADRKGSARSARESARGDAAASAHAPAREKSNYRIRAKREATPYHFFGLAAWSKDGAFQLPHVDERSKRWLFAYAYLFLMLLVVLSVFRLVPYAFSTMIVVLALALMDRKAIQTLDYGLLLTFVFFFVFAGNMSRIPAVDQLLSGLMAQWPLLVSAGLSQVISNVPAAVLLSHFADVWQPLLVGVNIGGAGTIVGSLASLITLQHYRAVRHEQGEAHESHEHSECREACEPHEAHERSELQGPHGPCAFSVGESALPGAGRFVGYMTSYNFAFLIILVLVCSVG